MGLTPMRLREVMGAAKEILGDDWIALKVPIHGQVLIPTPIEWWLPVIRYVNSSSGEYLAHHSLLAKPLQRHMELGDSGVHWNRVMIDGKKPFWRVPRPDHLADFAHYADLTNFEKQRDLHAGYLLSQQQFERWRAADRVNYIYTSNTRRLLVVKRVLIGSHELSALIADVQWVIEDDDIAEDYRIVKAPDMKLNSEFYSELLILLESADRSGVEDLFLETRRASLAALKIPASVIADVRLPEPIVPW